MPTLNDVLAGSLAQAVQVQQIIDALKGTPNKGVPIALVSLNDSTSYALTVQNDDPTNSRALLVLKADGSTLIAADSTGVTLGSPVNLPSGSITSTMIADGTITTADVGVNQIQNRLGSYTNVPTFSTTSVSTWVTTPIAVTFTSTGRPVRVEITVPLMHSVAGVTILVALYMDGVAQASFGVVNVPGSNYAVPVPGVVYLVPSAGTHTVDIRLFTPNAGTMAISNQASSFMWVTEELR